MNLLIRYLELSHFEHVVLSVVSCRAFIFILIMSAMHRLTVYHATLTQDFSSISFPSFPPHFLSPQRVLQVCETFVMEDMGCFSRQ